jgi:hypothetical protein
MSVELGRIWKEAVVAYSWFYPNVSPEGLKKTTTISVGIAGVLSEIRTEVLSTSLQLHLLRKKVFI